MPAKVVDDALRKLQSGSANLDTILLEAAAISEAGMLQALSDVSGMRLVNLADFEPNVEAGPMLPLKISRRLNVVPLSVDGNILHLAVGYPVPHKELREVAFLIGKELELWVALECRIKDWQTSLYREPMLERFKLLLKDLDPNRRVDAPPPLAKPAARKSDFGLVEDEGADEVLMTEAISVELLESIARGVVEEPVLLVKPKARRAAPPARALPQYSETTVLDTTGYANFARQVSSPEAPKKRLPGDRTPTEPEMPAVVLVAPAAALGRGHEPSFPGGVLPPRNRPIDPPPRPTTPEVRAVERAWVMPAASARPSIERLKTAPSAPRPPPRATAVTMPNVPIHDPPAAAARARDETDFSDVVSPSAPRRPKVTAAPAQKAGAALPVDFPRPSVPIPPGLEAPLPPEMRPSHGVAPAIASAAPSAPPELAAAAMDNFPVAAPSVPAFTPRLMSAAAGIVVPSGNPADWSLPQARAALKLKVQDREQLVAVALDYGRRAFEFVAAFAVVRGAALGWDARAEGEPPVVRHVSIPLDAASVFRTVALTRGSYVGPLPPDALTQHYLSLLGRTPRALLLWPVEVKGRLVAMLYGDSGSKPVSQRKLNDFILFCQDLPSAFGELIVFRKQQLGTSATFTPEVDPLGLPAVEPSVELPTEADFAQADSDWFTGLLTLLVGPDPRERANAMTELSRTPDTSARALVRAFPGPTAWSRLPVTELPEVDELGPIPGALARLGRPAAVALAPLLDADDSDTRYLALLTAGSLRYPELLDGVLRGLFDMEPDISSAARAAVTAMKEVEGYAQALRALRQELASRDPLRKSLAARALGMMHDKEAIEGLIGLTASDDQLCAQSAAEALREICRANHGPHARQWAAWYATARGRRRVEWLCDALESQEVDIRLGSVEELARAFGENLGYFADGPEPERASAIERWRLAIAARPEFEL